MFLKTINMREIDFHMPKPRGPIFYIKYAIREIKNRMKVDEYVKPTQVRIARTYYPEGYILPNGELAPLKDRYELIGQACLENKLILSKN